MGLLVDGAWQDQWYETKKSGGHFQRAESSWRGWITADGAAGPDGRVFPAESGRYHLYVSYACPWAHRTLIMRALKGLEWMIDVSVVHWFMGETGWHFGADDDGIVADRLHSDQNLYELYLRADAGYTGRVTVPVLWDTKQNTIVSNESADIIRMFNTAFDGIGATAGDYYPPAHREAIDVWNERIYNTVNNGVYRAGFATSQSAYEEAVVPLFETLEALDSHLAEHRYLVSPRPTEADWRMLPTLLRFDMVYFGHFKCNLRRLIDFPNLWAYTRELYQHTGIAPTCNFAHAKQHYYQSHTTINPTRIVPVGPRLDFSESPGRGHLR